MAKKVIATLNSSNSKDYVKVVKMIKSKKNGSYQFEEKILHKDKVKDYLEEE